MAFGGFDLESRNIEIVGETNTPFTPSVDLKNCILISGTIEANPIDVQNNDVILNPVNGQIIINASHSEGQILTIIFKRYKI